MTYDKDDPRATDLSGRVELLRMMAFDADRVAHAIERFAHQNRADLELNGYLRRLGIAARDFHGQIAAITASAPPSMRDAIERTR